MLLKFRDYIARMTDESNHYVLPNHALFQVANKLPESKSELRDALRQSWQGPLIGYADEILKMIATKV